MSFKDNVLVIVLSITGAIVISLLFSYAGWVSAGGAAIIGILSFVLLTAPAALGIRRYRSSSSKDTEEDDSADSHELTRENPLTAGEGDRPREHTGNERRIRMRSKLVLLVGVGAILVTYSLIATIVRDSVLAVFVPMALGSAMLVVATSLRSAHQRKEAVARQQSARIEEVREASFKEQLGTLSAAPVREGAPEVEVEAKYIYPLLTYLGYQGNQMNLRVPVPMQEGSRRTVRQADWVVRAQDSGEALVVVEAKAPRHELDDVVAKQARSYAFRLEAPVYVTANGRQLCVYHRGVLRDQRVLQCNTQALRENWDRVEQALGRSQVRKLKARLS